MVAGSTREGVGISSFVGCSRCWLFQRAADNRHAKASGDRRLREVSSTNFPRAFSRRALQGIVPQLDALQALGVTVVDNADPSHGKEKPKYARQPLRCTRIRRGESGFGTTRSSDS